MLDKLQQYSLWGQAFEIAVKRGVLLALLASGIRKSEKLGLEPWMDIGTADVYGVLARELKEVDPNLKTRSRETVRHLFQLGMGLGQTAMREYLRNLKEDAEDYTIQALWCPLQLPRVGADFDRETEESLAQFWAVFGLDGLPDRALTGKGFPARADFLLWLKPRYEKHDQEFLCLEFSLNGFPESADYGKPMAHLDELRRYAWFVDSRSVFSRVCAEVSGEGFALSPYIKEHLPAFTGRDKPLYKLCQAASYVQTTMRWLNSKDLAGRPFNTRALSITQNGFESLAAKYFQTESPDPRAMLMESLGRAYRETNKVPDYAEDELDEHIRFAFDQIRKALPKAMSKQFAELRELPEPGASVDFNFSEEIEGFYNPMQALKWDEALSQIDSDAALTSFFKQDSKSAITAALTERVSPGDPVPLRDLHASAIVAGMRASTPGQLTVLGLEGNPGIGKTTAVVHYLREAPSGFLFLYVSPRVIINDDVTGTLSCDRETKQPTGILTVTTNSKLIGAAKAWHEEQVKNGSGSARKIDSAVVAEGVPGLVRPDGSTLILSPEQKEELELIHTGSRSTKHSETERQDRISDKALPGVLLVLAKTSRSLLDENPGVTQLVLTAAIQGYRELGAGKSTLNALGNIFRNPVTATTGIEERRAFAQRIPTIVVMVDELTGDPAGARFVVSAARWLEEQFIRPFQGEPLFRVILVVSDASLGNEVVIDRYLNSGERAPDKILVAPSAGKRPFRLAATPVRIGGAARPVLHVMTNSYPAAKLSLDYRVRLNVVTPGNLPDGGTQSIRQAIAEQQGEALVANVVAEIDRALDAGADQIIFFAQDKAFLRAIEGVLTGTDGIPAILDRHQVAILDSSVTATKRKALIADNHRDTVKVFLMTSSGARGVSFPKTDWIIALIPRFGIEAALMEVAQLIYRGRGKKYVDDVGQLHTDGDWKNRRLVMLLQDFLPQDLEPEPRQWLRQVSDLLTFLVLLRSTIHTRITGDAGLDRQNLAIVPVGGIGSEEMLSLMSTHVRDFLKESDIFLRDSSSDVERRGLVSNAQKYAFHLFSKFSLDATAQQSSMRSAVRLGDLEQFTIRASADNAPLLLDPTADPESVLPENLYCVGPFWLEHWQDLEKQERFSIEGWLTDVGSQVQKLFGQLWRIHSDRSLPSKLRASAEELYRMLAREKEEATREFSTVKTLKSPSTWLVVPVDYARFWKPGPDGRHPSLEDEEAWRDSLGRCLSVTRNVLPVIPRYADIPYAAIVGEQDPARLDLVFDDRYVAASNELNLLNTILLAEKE